VPDTSSPMRRKQAGVAAGMALGLGITVLALAWPYPPAAPGDLATRLAVWAACDLLAGVWLVIAVSRLARHRFFAPDDIDAALAPGSAGARVLQSLIQNTLEQLVLAVIAYGAWLLIPRPTLPAAAVWAAAGCFSLGRVLFFAGYGRGAAFRALGFALTLYPTVGLMAVRAWLLVSTAS